MDRCELEVHVLRALDTLYARDACLIEDKASEWSIVHRLAVYLEHQLPGWDVDCEYNRQGPIAGVEKRSAGALVRPDIVVHHRRQVEREHNLIVIELKMVESDSDFDKVREYTAAPCNERIFQYQYGLALLLGHGPWMAWFENGHACS